MSNTLAYPEYTNYSKSVVFLGRYYRLHLMHYVMRRGIYYINTYWEPQHLDESRHVISLIKSQINQFGPSDKMSQNFKVLAP